MVEKRSKGSQEGAGDGSLWLGLDATACVRFDWLCAGALARFAVDPAAIGPAESARAGLDVLLTAEAPIAWSHVSLTPGVGLGLAWIQAVEYENGSEEDETELAFGGVLFEGQLRLGVPITDHLALDFGLFAGAAPFGDPEYDAPSWWLRGGIGVVYDSLEVNP